jgi:RNA recognition motif-containing protein
MQPCNCDYTRASTKPDDSDLSDRYPRRNTRPDSGIPRRSCEVLLLGWYEEKGEDAFHSKEEYMNKKLYVGGLSYTVTDSQLQQLFASHGTVESAKVVMDRDTDRSRGFGFVEMGTQEEAEKAITALNGTQHEGRSLTVNLSKPREDRPARSGGGYRDR